MQWLSEFVGQFNTTQTVFFYAAVAGTLFFLLRTVLMLVGFGGAGDAGHDAGADAGHAAGGAGHDAHHGASDSAFQLVSVHTITVFLMMFGWVGLACSQQLGMNSFAAVACAMAAGLLSMALIAYLFASALKLVSPGARFRIEDAVGKTASVYLKIPADGRGKVQVVLEGLTRELDAVAEDRREIASFQNVKVVRVVDHRTVAVLKSD